MENTVVERRIRCPYCAESMQLLLDLSAGDQSYIEDCQVCCQPMQVSYTLPEFAGHGVDALTAGEDSISLQVECSA